MNKYHYMPKMISGYLIVFVLIVTFFICQALAGEKQQITWIKLDFPPLYILSGDKVGLGFSDRVIDYFVQKLPQFDHDIVVYPNYLRIEKEAASGVRLCDAAAFYIAPEQRSNESPWQISAPHTVFSLHNIFIHRSQAHLFKPTESLRKLVSRKEFTLGMQAGRPFGEQLDSIIDKYSLKQNLVLRTAGDYTGLYTMLKNGSIDYVIDYYPQMIYSASKIGLREEEFHLVEIEEIKGQYSLAAIRCQKNMTEAINSINSVLLRERTSQEFKTMTQRWGVRKPNEALAEKIYQEKLLKIFE